MSARGISILLLCLTLLLTDNSASSLGTPASADAELIDEQSAPRFNPDVIKAPKGSARKAVLEARALGDHAQARAKALAALPRTHGEEEGLLRWLAAQSSRDLGEPHTAAELLLPVVNSDHPLAYWAKLSVAECYESKDPMHALALLDSLLAPSRDVQGWPGRAPAERARARVLDKLGRRQDAIDALERLASELPDDSASIQVLAPLSELLAQGDEAERVRAYALTRRIAVRAPDSKAGKRATELGLAMLASLPSDLRRELSRQRPEDKLVRADALLGSLRYDDAIKAYAEIESEAEDDYELRCRARYGRAKSLLDRRSRSEGAALMAEVAEGCAHDTNRRAWARYYAGRAFSTLGENERAIEQYEALERESPSHSLADDALYRAAKVARDMGDATGLVARLGAIFERYPHGDMQPRARFALAWEAYTQGDLTRAIEIVSADPRDEATEDLQGRSAYFRARWLGLSGDRAASVLAFASAFEQSPLSFYGQLAYSRLVELAPERARELSGKLARARGQRLTFTMRPELSSAGFRRAIALFSVNEVTLANWELRNLGFTSAGADVELALLSVALLDRSSTPELALEVARRHMPALLRRPPVGGDVAMYELVYPTAFASLIESAAKRENVPAAFLRAVAREESGFNPNAVSRAHAYGLVQLLVPTAKGLVKNKRERVKSGATLLKPELNLTLGARFMASIAASFRGQYALVPPAYNAGPGAVSRWLKERGDQPLDEWVENIPYDETRHYTRRVLQSYGIYHWLATAEMLRLPLTPTGGGPSRPAPAANEPTAAN